MGKEILIVDDAMFMRRIIRESLQEQGFENLLEAKDGEEAVKICRNQRPSLVFLDITMPGKSGMEVLKELLEIKPDIKVVMCSSIGQEETIRRATHAGAVDFIVKPFQRERIVSIAQKYLEQS
ncbi:two-component system response regulator [Clostridium sp. chh4-2]|uniref:response regulator n=1 Tax=Clostridium sp. chh4-2 TaxID=2067550 RepID=UPI000CCF9E1E|nr:response regulator [Clostridium sp. chh4-2]PNV62115.1 two-component system response regulator [Clostridium sp. chh4-2]